MLKPVSYSQINMIIQSLHFMLNYSQVIKVQPHAMFMVSNGLNCAMVGWLVVIGWEVMPPLYNRDRMIALVADQLW